ncbi:MAG: tyrosine--tRNA ligase [Candidatus Dadabacteria bacterium]|nr:tyrosine--tRNA ligase [Candidatus Dadabacteria bacterium]MDE0476939.1 tyrosine--tRNA ligase [Candidatus Dadabacteria bacterium]MXW43464.1 tyrosine--tRNA ligase [Candidatus Dadabacteria bacterium]MXZ48356.1 tyrosine--tRNA ligase [Candidatus Dadabacteria bacterium]MYB27015.1 tyrosine--tRNA ligase [Candidatus Dadabacteria bacterium]
MAFADPKEQLKVIRRGTEAIIPEEELLLKLEASRANDRPLKVKAGFDPTSPDLHLGHGIILKKLRDFQTLGHEVLFLIGDFTAYIGDPSGRSETRPSISKEEIIKNSRTYERQVFKVLDRKKTQILSNSRWLSNLDPEEFLGLTSLVNVSRILDRDDFSKRYREGVSISLREFIYPLVQAYDSVQMHCDVELGGTDQTFNILLGRDFQRHYGQSPQVGVFLPILEGTDGVKKMSKSLGNYIGLDESPQDIYGKMMSISDDLMWRYYLLLSTCNEKKIRKLRTEHPMDAKKGLAREVVSWLHDTQSALEAERDFETKFSKRSFPEDAKEKDYVPGSRKIVDLVIGVSDSVSTKGEAKRLISQGGLVIDGEKYTDPNSEFPDKIAFEIKIGKKEFLKVVIK